MTRLRRLLLFRLLHRGTTLPDPATLHVKCGSCLSQAAGSECRVAEFFRLRTVSHRPGFFILIEYSEVRAAMKSVRESLPPNES